MENQKKLKKIGNFFNYLKKIKESSKNIVNTDNNIYNIRYIYTKNISNETTNNEHYQSIELISKKMQHELKEIIEKLNSFTILFDIFHFYKNECNNIFEKSILERVDKLDNKLKTISDEIKDKYNRKNNSDNSKISQLNKLLFGDKTLSLDKKEITNTKKNNYNKWINNLKKKGIIECGTLNFYYNKSLTECLCSQYLDMLFGKKDNNKDKDTNYEQRIGGVIQLLQEIQNMFATLNKDISNIIEEIKLKFSIDENNVETQLNSLDDNLYIDLFKKFTESFDKTNLSILNNFLDKKIKKVENQTIYSKDKKKILDILRNKISFKYLDSSKDNIGKQIGNQNIDKGKIKFFITKVGEHHTLFFKINDKIFNVDSNLSRFKSDITNIIPQKKFITILSGDEAVQSDEFSCYFYTLEFVKVIIKEYISSIANGKDFNIENKDTLENIKNNIFSFNQSNKKIENKINSITDDNKKIQLKKELFKQNNLYFNINNSPGIHNKVGKKVFKKINRKFLKIIDNDKFNENIKNEIYLPKIKELMKIKNSKNKHIAESIESDLIRYKQMLYESNFYIELTKLKTKIENIIGNKFNDFNKYKIVYADNYCIINKFYEKRYGEKDKIFPIIKIEYNNKFDEYELHMYDNILKDDVSKVEKILAENKNSGNHIIVNNYEKIKQKTENYNKNIEDFINSINDKNTKDCFANKNTQNDDRTPFILSNGLDNSINITANMNAMKQGGCMFIAGQNIGNIYKINNKQYIKHFSYFGYRNLKHTSKQALLNSFKQNVENFDDIEKIINVIENSIITKEIQEAIDGNSNSLNGIDIIRKDNGLYELSIISKNVHASDNYMLPVATIEFDLNNNKNKLTNFSRKIIDGNFIREHNRKALGEEKGNFDSTLSILLLNNLFLLNESEQLDINSDDNIKKIPFDKINLDLETLAKDFVNNGNKISNFLIEKIFNLNHTQLIKDLKLESPNINKQSRLNNLLSYIISYNMKYPNKRVQLNTQSILNFDNITKVVDNFQKSKNKDIKHLNSSIILTNKDNFDKFLIIYQIKNRDNFNKYFTEVWNSDGKPCPIFKDTYNITNNIKNFKDFLNSDFFLEILNLNFFKGYLAEVQLFIHRNYNDCYNTNMQYKDILLDGIKKIYECSPNSLDNNCCKGYLLNEIKEKKLSSQQLSKIEQKFFNEIYDEIKKYVNNEKKYNAVKKIGDDIFKGLLEISIIGNNYLHNNNVSAMKQLKDTILENYNKYIIFTKDKTISTMLKKLNIKKLSSELFLYVFCKYELNGIDNKIYFNTKKEIFSKLEILLKNKKEFNITINNSLQNNTTTSNDELKYIKHFNKNLEEDNKYLNIFYSASKYLDEIDMQTNIYNEQKSFFNTKKEKILQYLKTAEMHSNNPKELFKIMIQQNLEHKIIVFLTNNSFSDLNDKKTKLKKHINELSKDDDIWFGDYIYSIYRRDIILEQIENQVLKQEKRTPLVSILEGIEHLNKALEYIITNPYQYTDINSKKEYLEKCINNYLQPEQDLINSKKESYLYFLKENKIISDSNLNDQEYKTITNKFRAIKSKKKNDAFSNIIKILTPLANNIDNTITKKNQIGFSS